VFDFFWFETPPEPELRNSVFYTAGFDGVGKNYRILEDGRLFRWGLSLRPRLFPYTGELHLWTSLLVDGKQSIRYDYLAKFDGGCLVCLQKL